METSDTGNEEEEGSFEIYDYFGDLARKDQLDDKKQPIDRENIIIELQNLQDEKTLIRKKNNLLQRKLADYYKKRKVNTIQHLYIIILMFGFK